MKCTGGRWKSAASKITIGLAACAALNARAVPPTVTLPNGLDLGNTSFLDGFGGNPSDLAVQSYLTFAHANAYKTNNGSNSPLFNNPQLNYFKRVLVSSDTWGHSNCRVLHLLRGNFHHVRDSPASDVG